MLRLATHNVRGLACHLQQLAQLWVHMRLDVVCVQETHCAFFASTKLAKGLNAACKAVSPAHRGFTPVWCFNTTGNATASAGVVVLVRTELVATGAVTWVTPPDQATRQPQGRLVGVTLQWGGHTFRLVSVHLPNAAAEQRAFISNHLVPAAHGRAPVLLGGDFNFVEDPLLDKVSVAGAYSQPGPGSPQAVFREKFPGLSDVFRALHPQRRMHTHHGPQSAARLDRWYAAEALRRHVVQCMPGDSTPSDHRPVVLVLAATSRGVPGPGVRRARLQQVWRSPQACERLQQALEQLCGAAPADDQQLISWWPAFKKRVMEACSAVARQQRLEQGPLGQQREAALTQLRAAFDQVELAAQQQDEAVAAAALQQVLQARAAWCTAVQQDNAAAHWQRRREWVHHQERPNPAFTAEVHTAGGAADQIPPLQSPATGRLVEGGRPLAQMVAEFWAGVSRQPAVQQQAADTVLAALAAQGRRLPPVTASAVGASHVSEPEVAAALKRSRSGRAPGLDGLPVEVYRKHRDLFVPLLARLYTAMGASGQRPAGFTDGVIRTLHKKGGRRVLANYRPITLLNTDYRVLANLLARRLRPVQGALIGREQTAFLPGRQIGENVLLLQLLPHALPASSKAVVVCLDFSKAYDTIDRGFLFRCLELAGLGGGFLQWCRVLLQDTHACACVNGHLSRMVSFQAGVRQGCPLAPQLYLFVAQALLAFLQARGWGVKVGAADITGCQYADDAQVLVAEAAHLQHFLADMQVFKEACGQGLNLSKTSAMPVGRGALRAFWEEWHLQGVVGQARAHGAHQEMAGLLAELQGLPPPNPASPLRLSVQQRPGPGPPDPGPVAEQLQRQLGVAMRAWVLMHGMVQLPDRLAFLARRAAYEQLRHAPLAFPAGHKVHGVPWVASVEALGVVHTADGASSINWAAKLAVVRDCYAKVAALPLSMFGRAFAASGYALSKLLYAAEFAGLPESGMLQELQRLMARLVDRGLAPASQQRKFAGVNARLLVGHPREGGCGVMPLQQHITARHAMWALRLVQGDPSTPWVRVARCILTPQLQQCPSWQQAAITLCPPGAQLGPLGQRLPPPLQRMAAALAALPALQDVSAQALPTAPGWCAQVPLWGNVFAVAQQPAAAAPRGLEAAFADVAALGTISTVGDAVAAVRDVAGCTSAQQYQRGLWAFWFARHPMFTDLQHANARMSALWLALPQALKDPVAAALRGPQPLVAATSCESVWLALRGRLGWPRRHGKPVTLAKATVRLLTQLQLGPQEALVAQRHAAYLELASEGLPPQQAATHGELLAMLRRAWRLPWDNQRKELLWRVALDGVPNAQRMAMVGQPCTCGVVGPGRRHHYWECPVAQAVVAAMQQQLPHPTQLQCVHVWLARPPHPALHKGVWLVVALAALLAMDHGRQRLYAWALPPRPNQPAPRLPPAGREVVVASKAAVAYFWAMLADFAGMRLCPPDWLGAVPNDHPFLATHQDGQEGVAALGVNRQQGG